MPRPPTHWIIAFTCFCFIQAAIAQTRSVNLFSITNTWRFQQNANLDGINWKSSEFDDASWGQGIGLFYVEDNVSVAPRNTPLTLGAITYYFRTHFQFTNGPSGASLIFSNRIDDGAVFYLNGVEVQRVRMPPPPTTILNATLAAANSEATATEVFTISGDAAATNLLIGDNVLAAEVHQVSPSNSDIVFGTTLTALVYTGAMVFATQPTNTSVLDGRPTSLTAIAIGNPFPVYQWFKDGNPIAGATNRSYVLGAAFPSASGTYYVRASNLNETVTSSNALLTVIDDLAAPAALSATGLQDFRTVVIPFNEAPAQSAATDISHYSVVPLAGAAPVEVTAAVLNGTNVVLTTTPRTEDGNYNLQIQGVHDISSRSNSVSSTLPVRFLVHLHSPNGSNVWRFTDKGEAPPSWEYPGFREEIWPLGSALFYSGDSVLFLQPLARTGLALTNSGGVNRVLTHYFRQKFYFAGELNSSSLRLRHFLDDGAIFYLNGQEFYSIRMPATRPISPTNIATVTVANAVYEPPLDQPGIIIPLTNLVAGENVLAVEVHQRLAGIADAAFAADIEATVERFLPVLRIQSPATIAENAGVMVNVGRVVLRAPLSTNLTIKLSSSDSNVLSTPIQLTIPAGSTNATFDAVVMNDGLLNGAREIDLSATANGFAGAKQRLQIADDEAAVLTLATPSFLIEGGDPGAVTVSVSQPPTADATISINVSNAVLTFPGIVVIPAGQTSATFSVSVPNDHELNGTRPAVIVASSPSWQSAIGGVSVRDDESTNLVLLLPASGFEGDGLRQNSGQIQLNGNALSNIVVSLSTSDKDSFTVPISIVILAGSSNAFFDAVFPENLLTDGTRTLNVTATAAGFSGTATTVIVYDNDPHHFGFNPISSPQYIGSNFVVTVTLEDFSGRRLSNFTSSISLTADATAGPVPVLPSTIGPFTNGQWSGPVRINATARMARIRTDLFLGVSNPFHVEPQPVRILNLQAEDMAYDPNSGAIFASVVSSAGYANRLVVIDPVTGTATNSYASAVMPGQLEISPNGQFLYATVSNRYSLQRFDLGTRTFGAPLILGNDGTYPYLASDITIINGLTDTVVASVSSSALYGGLKRFIGGVRSDLPLAGLYPVLLASSPTAPTLYGFEGGRFGTDSVLIRLNMNPVGGLLASTGVTYFVDRHFAVDAEVICGDFGEAVDATTLQLRGRYQASGPVVLDADSRRTIFLEYHGLANRSIEAFDRNTFLSLYRLPLPPLVNGSAPINRFLRWGKNGFAIAFGSGQSTPGQIWFVQSNLLLPTNPPADLVLTYSSPLVPPTAGSNTVYSLTVSNAGPGTATLVRLTNGLPANSRLMGLNNSSGVVTQSPGTLWWNLDELPAGAVANLAYSIVHSNAGWHHNRATVLASEVELSFANNTAHLPIFVGVSGFSNEVARLDFPIVDLLYDPTLNRILLSLDNTGGPQSNGIAILNPMNGLIESFTQLGTRPGKIARSGNSQFLYVSVPDLGGVRRLTLPTLGSDLEFVLGGGSDINGQWSKTQVRDMAVVPNQPNVLAVSRMEMNEYDRGVAIFENGVLRSNVTTTCSCTYDIEFANAGTLSATRGNGTVDRLVVDSNGIRLAQSATIAANSSTLSAAGALMYASAGRVFDPETLQYVGAFSGAENGVAVASDPANGKVFFITPNGGSWILRGYNTVTFEPLGSLPLPNITGTPTRLIRWGADGLAFRTTGGQLFLLRTKMLGAGPALDIALKQSGSGLLIPTNQYVTFVTTITNLGGANAGGVRFSNVLSGATLVGSVSSSQGGCTVSGNTVTCDLGALAAGEGAVIFVSALSSSQGAITSWASANAADLESLFSNNSAVSIVQVGTSTGATTVLPVGVPTLDVAWDDRNGRLLATINTNVPNWRDTLISLNPDSLIIEKAVPAGPDARRIVVAEGEVYVGNYNAIQVFSAATLTPMSRFTVGIRSSGTPPQPSDFAVQPGTTGVVAVTRGSEVVVFDNGTQRTNIAGLNAAGSYRMAFGRPEDLYLQNDYLDGFTRTSVGPSGASLVYNARNLTPSFWTPGDIKFARGLIYNNYGGVIDPGGPQLVATIPSILGGVWLSVDESASRLYLLVPGTPTWNLQAYELRTLLPAGTIPINGVSGSTTSFTHLGQRGFAFGTTGGQLFVIRRPLNFTNSPSDLALTFTQLPEDQYVGSNVTVTLTATNSGPASASNIVMGLLVPGGAMVVSASLQYTNYHSAKPGVQFQLGRLSSGATTNISITLQANAAGSLPVSAVLMTDASDSNQSNNYATVTVPVLFPAPVSGVSFLSLPARDIAYDWLRNLLYVSSGSDAIAVVNPQTGGVIDSFVGGPLTGRLRVTGNAEYLYASVSNGNALARFELAGRTRDLLFGTSFQMLDFEPLPAFPNTVVAAGVNQTRVFDSGIARPEHLVDSAGAAFLEFAGDNNRLYGNGQALSGLRRYRTFQITPGGIQEIAWNENVPASLGDFEFLDGLFYATSGSILAPTSGAVVATISGLSAGALVEPDSSSQRIFFLSQLAGGWKLTAYDKSTLSALGSMDVPSVLGNPQNLIRCGPNTLAFNTTSNQVLILRPSVDLQLQHSVPTNPVVLAGVPISVQWRLSSSTPITTAVVVSNRMPAWASFVGGSATNGFLSFTNGSVMWLLPSINSNSAIFADWQLRFTNTTDASVTNLAVAYSRLVDVNITNNSSIMAFSVFTDSDGNSVGDTWELANFGSLGTAANGDPDNDGSSNQQEFRNGTNPFDAANGFGIVRFEVSTNLFALTFFVPRTHEYAVDKAPSIGGPWLEVFTGTGGAQATWSEPRSSDNRFYRIRRK